MQNTEAMRQHDSRPVAVKSNKLESTSLTTSPRGSSSSLINEAIKRILLDIVIRGHGDRLIGRWSREPSIQEFLDQVPYLLDRINQLHLACSRSEHIELEHVHHYHANHSSTSVVRAHESPRQAASDEVSNRNCQRSKNGSLNDFIHLIGREMHWLVRTRDPLGLTPLHKAVLFNNRPIVDYILDRYCHELAPTITKSRNKSSPAATTRKLIDAQDKYGRTGLHYAAALLNNKKQEADMHGVTLYHILIKAGASQDVEDFRSNRASFYLYSPEKLFVNSIIHLANKLNASFQANILTKCLKASQEREIRLRELELSLLEGRADHRREMSPGALELEVIESSDRGSKSRHSDNMRTSSKKAHHATPGSSNKGDLSASCNELRPEIDSSTPPPPATRAPPFTTDRLAAQNTRLAQSMRRSRSNSNLRNSFQNDDNKPEATASCCRTKSITRTRMSDSRSSETARAELPPQSRLAAPSDHEGSPSEGARRRRELEACARKLMSDRVLGSANLAQSKRLSIARSLNESDLEKLTQLLVEGHGQLLCSGETINSCWNSQCKRYLRQVVPMLMNKLDRLHEAVARDQGQLVENSLAQEPILARILRPYRRASMNSLHVAIQLERMQIVHFLINEFPELIPQRDSNGATCLHYAARNLRLEGLYSWLLENYGSDLESLCDIKSRNAHYYRQQAIRLANFDLDHQQNSTLNAVVSTQKRDSSNREQLANLTLVGEPLELRKRNPGVSSNTTKGNNNPACDNQHKQSPAVQSGGDSPSRQLNLRKLETTIVNCIRKEDTKTLEQLILANCGRKIQDTYRNLMNHHNSTPSNPGLKVSENMKHFIEHHTPAYMETIARVHQLVHSCFSRREKLSKIITLPSDDNQLAEDDEEFNYSLDCQFLRLCNLFADNKRLLMSRDQYGASPLHVAMLRCDERLLEYILRRQPEAASAPDLQGRTPIHYAAMVCRVHKDHGDFRLTNNKDTSPLMSGDNREENMNQVRNDQTSIDEARIEIAYWLVDSKIHGIYEKLCARYNEIIDAMDDKSHKTPHQYLEFNPNSVEHVNLSNWTRPHLDHGRSAMPGGWSYERIDCDVIGSCCQLYANLLARYKYQFLVRQLTKQEEQPEELNPGVHGSAMKCDESIVRSSNEPDNSAPILPKKPDESIERVQMSVNSARHHVESALESPTNCSSKSENKIKVYVDNQRPSSTKIIINKRRSSDENAGNCAAGRPAPNRNAGSSSRANSSRSSAACEPTNRSPKTTDDLLSSLDGDLYVPGDTNSRFVTHSVQQVAPKPTVGSEAGFPLVSRSPTNLTGLKCDPSNQQRIVRSGAEFPMDFGLGCNKTTTRARSSSMRQTATSNSSRQRNNKNSSINESRSVPVSRMGSTKSDFRLEEDDDEIKNLITMNSNEIPPITDKNKQTNNTMNYKPESKSKQTYTSSHNKNRRKSNCNQNHERSYHQSVVGGVIVPSIIHDDKSGQIETYDIIYRQPSPMASRPRYGIAGNHEKITLSSRLTSRPDNERTPSRHSTKSETAPDNRRQYLVASPNDELSINRRKGSNLDSQPETDEESASEPEHDSDQDVALHNANDQDDTRPMEADDVIEYHEDEDEDQDQDEEEEEEEDDDDEFDFENNQVQRLSNEFDLRVTREKNELKAKVDQIMNEIKINSKTTQSIINPTKSSITNDNPSIKSPSPILRPTSSSASSTCTQSTRSSSQTTSKTSSVSYTGSSMSKTHNSHTSNSSSSSSSVRKTGNQTDANENTTCTLGSPASIKSTSDKQHTNTGNRNECELKNISAEAAASQAAAPSPSNKSGPNQTTSNPSLTISKNTLGQTYLHFICSRPQSAATLYKILEHAPHLIGERDTFYRTARDIAVQFNLPENVLIIDEFIIDAFVGRKTSLLRNLLNQGYSPLIHVSDPDGNDIMLILKLLKNDRMINLLLQMADFQRWRDELHTFIRHGYSAGVYELINKHPDLVKSKSIQSRTSLHLAVLFDRVDILDALLKNDPSCVHQTDCMGRMPLHYAYGLRCSNMVQTRQKLISYGADQEARDVKMRMPKYYSIFMKEIEDIKRMELELN